ncbi:unnamed protein product [Vitrella brassicaformis CCMP3155]|uniref:DUF4200 domain-containing protein n=2 Tax=Vitrella brassicaformis TaxID=1169539 RepID=A0A0G4EI50_VITBC|nr:unnamed protein product [Vitrella brassicaformis CCMP3155]|eukprot:CEL95673.1 unnamed protein product [Vitrella brassicaformis CCMP3155]
MRAILAQMRGERQTTLLLKKERQCFEVALQLDQTRGDVAKRLESCDEKMSAFEKRQEDLRRVVMDNVDFIRETDKKIEYAEKRIKEEEDEIAETEKQTQALEKELDMFKQMREVNRGEVDGVNHYQHYLESVATTYASEFEGEVGNLMRRFQTLRESNAELEAQVVNSTQTLEAQRQKVATFIEKTQNDLVRLTSELSEKQLQLDKMLAMISSLEEKVNSETGETTYKDSLISSFQMAISSLFARLVQKSPHANTKQNRRLMQSTQMKYGRHTEEMLKLIQERATDMRWVISTFHREHNKKAARAKEPVHHPVYYDEDEETHKDVIEFYRPQRAAPERGSASGASSNELESRLSRDRMVTPSESQAPIAEDVSQPQPSHLAPPPPFKRHRVRLKSRSVVEHREKATPSVYARPRAVSTTAPRKPSRVSPKGASKAAVLSPKVADEPAPADVQRSASPTSEDGETSPPAPRPSQPIVARGRHRQSITKRQFNELLGLGESFEPPELVPEPLPKFASLLSANSGK